MKNHTLTDLLLHSILLLTLSLLSVQTQAQAADIGTAITYQGLLDDGDSLVNGSYDFQFSLYDAVTAGTQVGGNSNRLSQTLTVTNGIFNTLLDFGAGVFNDEARFLEIAVRVNGGSVYTTLSPREPITTVPHATFVKPVENIVTVAKSGGDYTTIGAALAAITTASVDNPFLIRIGPGVYEETITLKSFVSIEGSGQGTTIIRGPGSSSSIGTLYSSGEIVAEVRRLSIEAVTTINASSVGISVIDGGDALNFTDITVVASGGQLDNFGVHNFYSSPTLSDVTIKAMGGVNSRAIYNDSNSSPTLINVTAEASDGTDVNFSISNNANSSPRLTSVISTAVGTNSVGLHNVAGSNPIIKDSELSGLTNSLVNDDTSSARVFYSQIDGPIAGDRFRCVGAYTDNSVVLNGYCLVNGFVYAIGDTGPGDGIVFYVRNGGMNGLEVAPTTSLRYWWGCHGTSITGADGTAIGTGAQNTADILAGCTDNNSAARAANNYVLNGFTDWFLPSKEELNELYLRKDDLENDLLDGFINNEYWSSSEIDNNSAWKQSFISGNQLSGAKTGVIHVFIVRVF